jgi:hypothetical protein
MKNNGPGNCCCCPTVGFEENEIVAFKTCCDSSQPITNLYQMSPSQLAESLRRCGMVYCGPSAQCGTGLSFPQSLWPTIRTWVEGGGRLFVAGEYVPCIGQAALDNINSFVASLGSSMSLGSKQCDSGCNSWQTQIEDVPLMEGITNVFHAATNEVMGGTPLARTFQCGHVPFLAIERIGQGWVMLAGDSNLTEGCGYNNCPLWNAFINNGDDEIL